MTTTPPKTHNHALSSLVDERGRTDHVTSISQHPSRSTHGARAALRAALVGLCAVATTLGGGSATASAADCTQAAPLNSCIPGGGNARLDCIQEWLLVPEATQRNYKGVPRNRVVCREGDPSCDIDPDLENASCKLAPRICINNRDPRLPDKCQGSAVSSFRYSCPEESATNPADQENRNAIELELGPGGLGTFVFRDRVLVHPGAVNQTPNLCSDPIELVVPLKHLPDGSVRKTRRRFVVRATAPDGRVDKDQLIYWCLPSTCGDRKRQPHEQCDDGNRSNGDGCNQGCKIESGPTPTPSTTPTTTPTPTPTRTPTPTPTSTPTRTPTPTPTALATPTPTPTAATTPTPTPVPATPTPTPTPVPATPTPTPTPVPATPTPTPTPVPATPTPTPTPVPATPTPTPAGTPLGTWSFGIATGSNQLCPLTDVAAGSQLRGSGLPASNGSGGGTICSLSRGNFSANANFQLVGGVPDASGIASLSFNGARVVAVQQPALASNNWVCVRVESNGSGWVDCDGGSDASVAATVDSNSTDMPPPPIWDDAWLSLPSATDSGAGAARIPVKVKSQNLTTTCPAPDDASWDAAEEVTTVLTTAQAQSTITDPRRCPNAIFGFTCPNAATAAQYQTTLAGLTSLSCSAWTTQTAKFFQTPIFFLDIDFGSSNVGDIAIVARLKTSP